MTSLFFYGTLCHQPLRDIVLGTPRRPEPAALPDHAVHWAAGQSFPLITAAPGAIAPGLLLRGVTAQELARLDFYEGAFGYTRRAVRLANGTEALTYFPARGDWQPGVAWCMNDWAAERGAVVTATAQDFMALMGQTPGPEIAERYGLMLVRGAATLRAEAAPAPATLRHDPSPGDVEVLARQTPYAKFFAVEEYDLTHRRFDGSRSAPINRTVFISADAATVLPYDPVHDLVLLVEQIRPGPLARGTANPWMLEAIAGRVDAFETPEDCVRREAMEEAGLEIDQLLKVAEYFPSTGAKAEFLYSYVALCDLSQTRSRIGGMATEDEDIRSHVIPFPRLMELIFTPEAANAPLILTALWLSTQRESLRAEC